MIYINEHEVILDEAEGLQPWAKYDRVIRLAMDFIRRCPIEPRTSTIQKCEVPIALFWTFDCMSKAKDIGLPLKLVIPSEGTVAGVYVQFAPAAAPHPNAAKLMLETMFSDEGQLNYAMGYTHPMRETELPADLKAQFPPGEAYANVYFPQDFAKLTDAAPAIAEGWDDVAQ
jgi:putative spermidine/putrescine transport system substrate-binding protein